MATCLYLCEVKNHVVLIQPFRRNPTSQITTVALYYIIMSFYTLHFIYTLKHIFFYHWMTKKPNVLTLVFCKTIECWLCSSKHCRGPNTPRTKRKRWQFASDLPANIFYTHQVQREYQSKIQSVNKVWGLFVAPEDTGYSFLTSLLMFQLSWKVFHFPFEK